MLNNMSDNFSSRDGGSNDESFDHENFLSTGILERYVYGEASEEECSAVHAALKSSAQVRASLLFVELVAEEMALLDAVEPDPIIKPFLFSTIDVTDRIKGGEVLSEAPLLNAQSTPADFDIWLNRADMVPPAELDDVFAKIISITRAAMTAIVWIKTLAPQEVHHDQYERFLILEGSCDIHMEGKVYPLKAGSFFQIPLHVGHEVIITSEIPCKAILQRVAA